MIACLEAIKAKHHMKIDIDVVKASYVLKKYSGCPYTFTNMDKANPVILNLDRVNDRGWKHSFLFAEKSTLHAGCEDLMEYWSALKVYFFTFVMMFSLAFIMFDVMPIRLFDYYEGFVVLICCHHNSHIIFLEMLYVKLID